MSAITLKYPLISYLSSIDKKQVLLNTGWAVKKKKKKKKKKNMPLFQLSYIALTSTTLTQELFPTLFMVNQIMDDINPLRIKMMQYFNWNKVGTIFFQNDIWVSVSIFVGKYRVSRGKIVRNFLNFHHIHFKFCIPLT